MADPAQAAAIKAALHELETAMGHVNFSRYMGIAGYSLLIYDHLLTFSDEVELVWKADKRNVVTWLFFLNRYLVPVVLGIDLYDKGGLASHLTKKFCQTWFLIEGYINVLSFAAVHALVAMRVSAVWGRRKWVNILLWAGGSMYIIGTLAIISPGIVQVLDNVEPNPIFNVCFGTITSYFWAVWIPPIIFEAIIFTLTVIKAIEHRNKNLKTPVAYTLYRFLYFIVISLCSIFPLIVWLVGPPTLVAMPKYFTMAIVNVMGFRLVLNLRGLRGDRIMPSSGGGTSDDMELSEVKGSRNNASRDGRGTFSPGPQQPVVVISRPGFISQNSDARVTSSYAPASPKDDSRWQNRQVGYAGQTGVDRFSRAEKGYPPGINPYATTMLIVGLTGGIGSGKSTVSSLLASHGLPIVDADLIAREVVQPGEPAHAAICSTFGPSVLVEGTQDIDRKKLGAIIFNDEQKRKQLNAIVHPAVRKAMFWSIVRHWISGQRVCIVDVPLLIETGMWKQVGKVIVVYVSKELQMQRLMRRDSSDRAAAQSRVSSQLPLASKLEYADLVIDNSGTLADTERQVNSLVQRLEKETGWTWLISWLLPPVGLFLGGWCLVWRAIKRSRKTKRRPVVPREGAIELS
ncbi:dephospho-CoA kinase [Ceratobasidium sp. AG-Ba]|nr:dephospho-CoA kinase [Ceratobasidium sp. AG-Ba]